MKKRYAVVVELAGGNYGAHAPDVPGCISTGATIEETLRRFQEALEFHLEGTAEDGDPIPEPTTVVDYVEVEMPAAVGA